MAATAYLTGKLVLNVLILPDEGAQANIHHQGGMIAWLCLVKINDAAHVHLAIERCDHQWKQTAHNRKANVKSRSSVSALTVDARVAVCPLCLMQSSL